MNLPDSPRRGFFNPTDSPEFFEIRVVRQNREDEKNSSAFFEFGV
jgi:hypothetical protein